MQITGLKYHAATNRMKNFNNNLITQEQLLSPKNSGLIKAYRDEGDKIKWYSYKDADKLSSLLATIKNND